MAGRKKTRKLIIRKTDEGFRVRDGKDESIYKSGKSPQEAVGNLIFYFGKELGVEVEWSKDEKTTFYLAMPLMR